MIRQPWGNTSEEIHLNVQEQNDPHLQAASEKWEPVKEDKPPTSEEK